MEFEYTCEYQWTLLQSDYALVNTDADLKDAAFMFLIRGFLTSQNSLQMYSRDGAARMLVRAATWT